MAVEGPGWLLSGRDEALPESGPEPGGGFGHSLFLFWGSRTYSLGQSAGCNNRWHHLALISILYVLYGHSSPQHGHLGGVCV